MDKILKELLMQKDKHISGSDLAKKYGISRAAVWKKIKSLKNKGYVIESVTNKGYRLVEIPQGIIQVDKIKEALADCKIGNNFLYFEELDSTNAYLKENADNLDEGSVVFAEYQTKARGRFGRSWENTSGENIQLSILLKPQIQPTRAPFITLIAGAAELCVLRDLGVEAKIKWPNDIIVKGKKISGILTELSLEIMDIKNIIVGVGINVSNKDFSKKLNDKAASLYSLGYDLKREDIVIGFIKAFDKFYFDFVENDSRKSIVDLINRYSITNGKWVKIIENQGEKNVLCKGIDDLGMLIVETEDGQELSYMSGEISLRKLDGSAYI